MIVVTAALFAIFHIVVVSIPVLSSGGAGESQAFAAALFDLPLFWALGMFPDGRSVLYGSSPRLYMFVFAVGGTLMYAAIGALAGWGMQVVRRAFHAG